MEGEGQEGQEGQQGQAGQEGQQGQQGQEGQQGGANYVPKEKYDELRRQMDALEATTRALAEGGRQQDQGQQGYAPTADDYIRDYARNRGISIDEAQQWWDSTNPIVDHRLNAVVNQVTPIITGMADKLALMELANHPDYGDLYREHRAEVTRIRNEAVKAGSYLTPEAALHLVVSRAFLESRKKGISTENEETAEGIGEVTQRARVQSASGNLKGTRKVQPKAGPATHDDIAKMTPEERIKFFEDAADRGETF